MKNYTTPDGKTMEVYYHGRSLALRLVGPGKLPKELQGIWTDMRSLDLDMVKYFATKEKSNDTETGLSTK